MPILLSSQSSIIQASACFPLVCRPHWPRRKARLDRVQNLRRVCEILRLSFQLRQQHWHCPQTSRQSIEFQNMQPGSQIFNCERKCPFDTPRLSGTRIARLQRHTLKLSILAAILKPNTRPIEPSIEPNLDNPRGLCLPKRLRITSLPCAPRYI